jgi:hypothetical protein
MRNISDDAAGVGGDIVDPDFITLERAGRPGKELFEGWFRHGLVGRGFLFQSLDPSAEVLKLFFYRLDVPDGDTLTLLPVPASETFVIGVLRILLASTTILKSDKGHRVYGVGNYRRFGSRVGRGPSQAGLSFSRMTIPASIMVNLLTLLRATP